MTIIQQLREAFLAVKPKHAVFGRRRQVTSEPIELSLNVSFESSIEAAIGEVGVVSWVDGLSPHTFMKQVSESFISRVIHELDRHFSMAREFNQEEFNICVSKIKRQDLTYRLHLAARG